MDLGMTSILILNFTPCTKGTPRHLSDEPLYLCSNSSDSRLFNQISRGSHLDVASLMPHTLVSLSRRGSWGYAGKAHEPLQGMETGTSGEWSQRCVVL